MFRISEHSEESMRLSLIYVAAFFRDSSSCDGNSRFGTNWFQPDDTAPCLLFLSLVLVLLLAPDTQHTQSSRESFYIAQTGSNHQGIFGQS